MWAEADLNIFSMFRRTGLPYNTIQYKTCNALHVTRMLFVGAGMTRDYSVGNVEKMSLKFTFKNIDRVASSNVKRQIVPIYSSGVFETTRRWSSSHVADRQEVLRGWAQITTEIPSRKEAPHDNEHKLNIVWFSYEMHSLASEWQEAMPDSSSSVYVKSFE